MLTATPRLLIVKASMSIATARSNVNIVFWRGRIQFPFYIAEKSKAVTIICHDPRLLCALPQKRFVQVTIYGSIPAQ